MTAYRASRPTGKKLTALATALTLSASLGVAHAASQRVAAVVKDLDNPFFGAMADGLRAQAKTSDTDLTVQAVQSITNSLEQANKLQALAGQSYGCYVVDPISQTNLVQPLVSVGRKGRPIVNIDNPIGEDAIKAANLPVTSYIGTDNVAAGRLAADAMSDLVPKGSDVAMIGGIPGGATSEARLSGFRQGAKEQGLEVVQTVAAKWKRQRALTKATYILRSRPDVKGFFVANDDMGLGVVRAIANAGRTGEVAVVSIDGIKEALTSIKQGGLSATVSQYPYSMGRMGLEACRAAMTGHSVPRKVDAPVLLVTPKNVDSAIEHFPRPFKPYDDPFASSASNQ